MRRSSRRAWCVAGLCWAAGGGALALETVVISASGLERRVFETPYAVNVVDAEALRSAGPLVQLSEALARVPGLVVNTRNNYAQDLQISSRGFGARASFGVRGLRLYADGIPASGPDGQGQVSHFDLAGAARVEVLRGPFSALYGSSSGGVISLVSAAPTERHLSLDLDAGAFGLRQWRLGFAAPLEAGFNLRAQLSRLETDGQRLQSAAQRTLGNLRLGWEGDNDRVVLVLNALNQPALDPLGLTRLQLDADASQTTSLALPQDAPGQPNRFNTRKNTWQDQAGLSWRHRFASGDGGGLSAAQLSAYAGKRSVTQWQSIPVATQVNPTNPALSANQAGGVIDFDRNFQGLDARLVWRWPLGEQRSLQLVAGGAADTSREDRRGFENFSGSGSAQLLGVTGRLRRDETNRLSSRDLYAQLEADLTARWALTLGLRSGRIAVDSDDHYIVGNNRDDSGQLSYAYTNPVAALQWRASDELNAYLSLGRGFESPTLNELAYRSDGLGGFNTDLRAQTSRQIEIGAKWRPAASGVALDVALFQAQSEDEIGVATNSGGRTTFRNVGRTLRRGAELSLTAPLAATLRTHISLTWLDAQYRDAFAVCASVPCTSPTVPVPAGNRIAGTTQHSAFAELVWSAWPALELAAEWRGQGRVAVNDLNSDFAAGFGLLALRARWRAELPLGRLDLLARLDNLADRRGAGSVLVGEGNGRFFEPLAGRAWGLSMRWALPF